MRHHVLAEQLALVGETLRLRVGRRLNQQARVLPRPSRWNDDARLLPLALLLVVVVLDAGHLRALLVGEHARDRRQWSYLGAGLARVGEVGDQRVGERAGRAADMAPAV